MIHRDLYEEQLLVGSRVALIDLDDAALGPPELDLGNLLAHIELLAERFGHALNGPVEALFAGYLDTGSALDRALLERCTSLSLLRLACIHDRPSLLASTTCSPVLMAAYGAAERASILAVS